MTWDWVAKPGDLRDGLKQLRLRTLLPLVETDGWDEGLATEALTLSEGWLKDRSTLDAETVFSVLDAAAWNMASAICLTEMAAALRETKVQRERGVGYRRLWQELSGCGNNGDRH